MSNAFVYRMPSGIAGDVTRREHAKIESWPFDSSNYPTRFGEPVKLTSGKICKMASGDAEQPYGFLVRPYPSQSIASEALGVSTPDPNKIGDILVSGYMTVDAFEGTPAAEGQVYYYNANDTDLGKVSAGNTDSPATAVAITGCQFMGAADTDGNVEIKFNV